MYGVFEGDPFRILVPPGWQGYPGVTSYSYRHEICKSKSGFAKALGAAKKAREKGTESEAGSIGSGLSGRAVAAASGKAVDVAGQRGLIRSFMEEHGSLSGANHPLATRCPECKWKLDCSPTKNPDVPHCEWGARRRNVEFKIRSPMEEGSGPEIPLCRQYGPTRSWDDTIPEHHAEPSMPRTWMLRMIELMDQDVGRRTGGYGSIPRSACELLTGRPLSAKESNGLWFSNALKEEIGNLSDRQLATLFHWVAADWMRVWRSGYLLPLADGRVVEYRERGWRKTKKKAKAVVVEAENAEAASGEVPSVEQEGEVTAEEGGDDGGQ